MSGDEPPPGEEPGVVVRTLGAVTPDRIRRNFAVKFGLVLVVMAVSIGTIGWAATEALATQTQADFEEDLRSAALQESDVVGEWLARNRLSTRLVSAEGGWNATDPATLGPALAAARANLSGDVADLHLVDADGNGATVVATTSPSLSPGTAVGDTDRRWFASRLPAFESMATGDVHVEDTYATTDARLVGLISPVRGVGDRYLLVEVSLTDVTASLRGRERAGGGFTRVVAGDGTVVLDESSRIPGSAYADDPAAMAPVQEAGALREAGRAVVDTSMAPGTVVDTGYAVGASPIAGSDWVAVTHAPRNSVFGFARDVQRYGLFATAAAVLLIGVVGALLGYSTSTSIDRLTAKTEEMQAGDLDVSVYSPRVDNIGRLHAGFADMRDSLRDQIDEAERARKEAEVARAEAEEMATYLREKAQEYSEIMRQCAAGDLTRRMETDGEEDSMDRIAEEFNDMIEELELTTGQLKSYVDEVERAGAEVERSTDTVRRASAEVADSVQRISEGATDQRERLRTISSTLDRVAARLEDDAAAHPDVVDAASLDELRSVASNLEETAELSEATRSEAENVAGAAEEQAAELNDVGERAHDLQRYAAPLRDVLGRFHTEAEHEFVFAVGPTTDDAARADGDAAADGVDAPETGAKDG
jgi:methyl-accepting chemotaxis protein